MKILFHSNAPWAPTGYGRQTALFAPLLNEHHDVTLSSNYGLEAAPLVWDGMPVLAGLGGSHGNETLPGHVESTFGNPRDGLVLTLYDTLIFDPQLFAKLNVACWCPVDHDPVSPGVVAFLRESAAIPIAMSRYGQAQLAEFDPLYVPHAVDTSVFKPTPSNTREQMGVPDDAFLVTMVAANKGSRPSRKAFQQALQAMGELRKRHDDVFFYLHTVIAPEWADGEDLLGLMAALNLPADLIKLPDQYSMIFNPPNEKHLAKILTASDVLLHCSMGEGFGVGIIEAQACGTPVIVTRCSAMPELVGAGWEVGGTPFWTAQKSWMQTPDVEQMVEALEQAYYRGESAEDMSERAVDFAQQYDVHRVMDDYMLPALAEIAERLGDREPLTVAA